MVGREERDAYERVERAIREIHKALGREALEEFSRRVEILARKFIEEVEE